MESSDRGLIVYRRAALAELTARVDGSAGEAVAELEGLLRRKGVMLTD